MKSTNQACFEDLLEITGESLRHLVITLRELIMSIHPNAIEVIRLGDRGVTFGVGPKKMSEGHTYIIPYSSHVNLGFYKGAILDDPKGLLEGTGKSLRHIKIRSKDELNNKEVQDLIKAAVKERQVATGKE